MTAPPRSFHGATYTLRSLPQRSLSDAISLGQTLLSQGLRLIELRDDLLTDDALWQCKEAFSAHHILLSLRRERSDQTELVRAISPHWLDIAHELGPIPSALSAWMSEQPILRTIRSLHARPLSTSVAELLTALSQQTPPDQIIKVAIPIHNIRELTIGHNWQRSDPQRHVFLPIASDGSGRFRFYRLLLADSQRLHFLCDEDAPLVPDQPSAAEWAVRLQVPIPDGKDIPFAAIVGNPVEHSRTPAHHAPLFAKYGMPVLKVCISDDDLHSQTLLSDLLALGLRAAAVTSPCKAWLPQAIRALGGHWQQAPTTSDHLANDSQDAGNTLVRCPDGRLIGCSTDGVGLRAAWHKTCAQLAELMGPQPQLAVFGGGGLLSLLRAVFPDALFVAARTGLVRSAQGAEVSSFPSPAVLIWSVGRSRYQHPPPAFLRPRLVFDLNYAADSPGRDFAAQVGAHYVDGSDFFVEQAAAQQVFWKQHLQPLPSAHSPHRPRTTEEPTESNLPTDTHLIYEQRKP